LAGAEAEAVSFSYGSWWVVLVIQFGVFACGFLMIGSFGEKIEQRELQFEI
jgi:hypothetical protein